MRARHWWHGSYYRSLLAIGTDRWGPYAVPAWTGRASWALVALVPCGAPYGVVNEQQVRGPSGRAVVPQGLALEQGGRLRPSTRRSGASRKGRNPQQIVCGMDRIGRRRRLPCRKESVEDLDRACP